MINYFLNCRKVDRLGLVYHHRRYDLMQHQWMVGMLFRYFASLEDVSYDINVWEIVLKHDMLESVSMDLPYPVKTLNKRTEQAWSLIEKEIVFENSKLSRYSDKNIKEGMTDRQFALFKVCDYLDLFLFIKEEMSYGNNCKEIIEVEQNCFNIFDSIFEKFSFPKIKKFITEYVY